MSVMAGHSASEDARERAYAPAINPLRKTIFTKKMEPLVKPAGNHAAPHPTPPHAG
jgi:hypothetical protein